MIAIAGRVDLRRERLYSGFKAIWPKLESHDGSHIAIAAGPHRGASLFQDVPCHCIAGSGEVRIYQPRKDFDLAAKNELAHPLEGFLQVGSEFKQNPLDAYFSDNEPHFYSGWIGNFPQYYPKDGGCLLVTSHLEPFADEAPLAHACNVPFPRKIHNYINQKILSLQCRALLSHSLAATLVESSFGEWLS